MYHRTIPPLAAALALAGLTPMAGGAQSAPSARTLALTLTEAAIPTRPALKPAYHVRLTSTWPQEAVGGGCRNGGEETIEGTLAREADGTYTGTFARRTELLFCGTHGTHQDAESAACELALIGRGDVSATGVVRDDEASPSGQEVRLVWTPAPAHQASVSGACDHGIQAGDERDVSLHAARGGVSAHSRGRGPAEGAAGELCVEGGAGVGESAHQPRYSFRLTSMSTMIAGGVFSKTMRRSTVRMTIFWSGPLPLPRPRLPAR